MTYKKIDKNHTEIVECARKLGFSVQSLHTVGKDCPDAIFGYDNLNLYCEIKSENGKLSDGQQDYHDSWQGQICTIYSVEDLMIEYLRYSYKVYGTLRQELIELITRFNDVGKSDNNVSESRK